MKLLISRAAEAPATSTSAGQKRARRGPRTCPAARIPSRM